MTASDWAFFWHKRYFYNHNRLFWWIGQMPAWSAMVDNRIDELNHKR